MFPTLDDLADFKPRAGYLWDCEFDNFNILNGKKFPATSVTFDDVEPLVEQTTIGPGIPITYIKGYKYPEKIDITFMDNQTNEIREKLNKYIQGKFTNKKIDFLSRKGVNPKEIIDKKLYLTLKINEYNEQLEVIKTYTFMVVPDKALTMSYNNNTIIQENMPMSFKIIGIVDGTK